MHFETKKKSVRKQMFMGAAVAALAPAALVSTATVFSTSAYAQSAVGSVFGTAGAGEEVTITSSATGLRLTTTADSGGAFRFTQLAPGNYTVSSASGSQDVVVKVGTGTPANLVGDTIVVRGSGVGVSPVDVSSVESTTVFTADDFANLPIPQDISSVALLAPGTVASGHPNFGNLVSIGGSSVAENGYYINGFDVTNIRTFLSFADLPFQAIAQQQVKTGGYGAEFGRSLGGVLNLVTKRGTNDWTFGGSVQWSPESLRSSGKNVLSNDPDDLSESGNYWYVYRNADRFSRLKYNGYVSGPIIEDRLFFFGIVEMNRDTNDYFDHTSSESQKTASPMGLVKIDANLFDGHTLELTGIYNKQKSERVSYAAVEYYPTEHAGEATPFAIKTGGLVGIAKYTGRFTDNFTLSAQYGYLESELGSQEPDLLPGYDCVAAYDSTSSPGSLAYTGCWNEAQFTILDPDYDDDVDTREAIRADVEWLIGDHTFRFGYDREVFTSTHRGEGYSGYAYWRHYQVGAMDTIIGNAAAACGVAVGTPGRCVSGEVVAQGQNYVRLRDYFTGSASYAITNEAFYVEDSWQITPEFMLYAGARFEAFENRNGEGDAFVSSDYEFAPRAGFSWDVNGDSSLKVFGTYGRYFIPVASNTNIRASGIEYQTEAFFLSSGFDSATGEPTGLGMQLGTTSVNGNLTTPNVSAIATQNLSPMYQDEYILGAQKMVNDATMIGVRGIYRDLKSGMDDHCSFQPFLTWAEDNGYDATIDFSTIAPCHIINPGQDVVLDFDADGTGIKTWTVDAEYFRLPAIERTYWAAEVFWDYRGDNLTLNGSYTMSWLKGNSEGYVNTDLGQDDAGLTQDWDNYLFTLGAYGYLNNDRRHSFKMFGAYDINEQFAVSANLLVQSGRPISCLGYIDLNDPFIGIDRGGLALYGASSFNCTNPETGVKEVQQRGSFGRTPWSWDLDVGASYRPNFADGRLRFRVDAFNVFNNQQVVRVSQSSELGGASAPSQNLNFLNDIDYQSPRSVRFTLTYDYN